MPLPASRITFSISLKLIKIMTQDLVCIHPMCVLNTVKEEVLIINSMEIAK